MAEIKSAIELAMERTRGLVMDDREKTMLADRELRDRVKAVYRRYREGLIDAGGARAELDELTCDNALERKIVLGLMEDEPDLIEDFSGMTSLISFIGLVIDERSYHNLKGIEKIHLEELEKTRVRVRSQIADELASSGITGDSVEPNVEAWPKWQEASHSVLRSFREQIEKWKS